jgi:photosystem II stability/assembly factor-like uncharacterized protein
LSDIVAVNQIVYTCGDSSRIYKSTNSGVNWQLVHSPVNNAGLSTFSFLNELTGFVSGSVSYKTTNGGNNWIQMPYGNFRAIEFFNEMTGYAISSNSFYKTTNGGLSYSSQFLSPDDVWTFDMLNETTGWVVYRNGFTYCRRTTNGGMNWIVPTVPIPAPRESISFFDSTFGIIVGWTDVFNISTNGGVNWSYTPSGINGSFDDVQCVTRDVIYAVGLEGMIVKSTNGGVNWLQQASGTTQHLFSVHFINENTGFACGFGGIVLRTTNGGVLPVVPIGNTVPVASNLYQNYPNPFNPVTKIKFEISKSENVLIKIYDAAGKMITELVNQKLSAGTYSVEWNAVNYPSGAYYYTIRAGDFMQSKKMILLK